MGDCFYLRCLKDAVETLDCILDLVCNRGFLWRRPSRRRTDGRTDRQAEPELCRYQTEGALPDVAFPHIGFLVSYPTRLQTNLFFCLSHLATSPLFCSYNVNLLKIFPRNQGKVSQPEKRAGPKFSSLVAVSTRTRARVWAGSTSYKLAY